ncbi:hypothetical protein FRC03_003962 [Tulasnella sp. 419]|nr:hypothetical protein FRC03_003962 [Tulasnella sp. 419]
MAFIGLYSASARNPGSQSVGSSALPGSSIISTRWLSFRPSAGLRLQDYGCRTTVTDFKDDDGHMFVAYALSRVGAKEWSLAWISVEIPPVNSSLDYIAEMFLPCGKCGWSADIEIRMSTEKVYEEPRRDSDTLQSYNEARSSDYLHLPLPLGSLHCPVV